MSHSAEQAEPRDAFAALRFGEFRYLTLANFCLVCAILMQEVVLGYELYLLTGDPLVLGLVGLAQAIPFIGLALFGGHLADRREKRGLILRALCVVLLGSFSLVLLLSERMRAALPQTALLWIIYGDIMLLGLARGIYSPTASSLRAFLVPRAHYANASAWWSSAWQSGSVIGPVLAGFFYAWFGLSGALLFVCLLLLCALWAVLQLQQHAPQADVSTLSIWKSLREGLSYVRRTRIILYAISLDMFSVLFGGVVAILPIYAEDILQVGPQGLGLLRAAPAVGAVLTMLWLTVYPPVKHPWRDMLLAVVGFGVATLVFAVSPWLWLSLIMLFFTGAFDSVSVVVRQTVLLSYPPDALRGRVQAVNSIFVSSSNELGAFESGLAARLMGTVPSVLFGGAMTLITVGWIWRRSRDLFSASLKGPGMVRER